MQLRTGLVGLLALVFSASAASAVFLFTRQPMGKPEVEMVSIVVANQPIPRGVTLTKEMMTIRQWPKEFVSEGALLDADDAVGRTVWVPLVQDDMLVESKLGTKGAGRGLASLIPRGMRAVTIQTPNVSTGVAGFILPGNKVDVLWTVSQVAQKDDTGGGSTATLLQNVEILAVDQQIEMPHENKVDLRELRSVTLLVSPPDASKLDLAQNRGTLRLSLRNPEDSITDDIHLVTLSGMRGGSLPDDAIESGENPQMQGAPLPPTSLSGDSDPGLVRTPELMLPFRTLRGTSSGGVRLRHPGVIQPSAERLQEIADRSR